MIITCIYVALEFVMMLWTDKMFTTCECGMVVWLEIMKNP